MDNPLTAFETKGYIDEKDQLQLDDTLPVSGPMPVRVIVLYPTGDNTNESEWLKSAVANQAFLFLADEEEDIYTLTDGKPLNDQA